MMNIFQIRFKTKEEARQAILQGVTASVVSITLTLFFAVLPFFGVHVLPGMDASVFADIAVMMILTAGLFFNSRISACFLVFYFFLGKVSQSVTHPELLLKGLWVALFFLYLFIRAAAASFAYWRRSEQKPARFSWKILASAFLILLILIFSGGGEYDDGLSGRFWLAADTEVLSIAPEAEGPREDITQVIGHSNFKYGSEHLFAAAVVKPGILKAGEPAVLTYTLYTRLDTRYEGFTMPPDPGDLDVVYDAEREMIHQETQVLGVDYIAAEIEHFKITAPRPGQYTLHPGTLMVLIKDPEDESEDGKLYDILIDFPELRLLAE